MHALKILDSGRGARIHRPLLEAANRPFDGQTGAASAAMHDGGLVEAVSR
jgi:hypothetical protein